MIDTGDWVRHKITREKSRVACVHAPIAYLCGHPPVPVRLDDLELLEESTQTDRHALLEDLARGTGNGHRPRCARERLAGADSSGV